jgi:hypothetical protein
MNDKRSEAYCHRCRRVTPRKRTLMNAFPAIALRAGSEFAIVQAACEAYEANRPLRCGICGTTYSLIESSDS